MDHVAAFDVSCSCGWSSLGHYSGAEADRAHEAHEAEEHDKERKES